MKMFKLGAALGAIWLASAPAHANPNGSWRVNGSLGGQAFSLSCTFTAAGSRLTGQCVDRGSGGNSPIKPGTVHRLTAGSVAGNRVQWVYKAGLGGVSVDVNYAGTVTGNRMTGTISLAGMGRGNFTAVKG